MNNWERQIRVCVGMFRTAENPNAMVEETQMDTRKENAKTGLKISWKHFASEALPFAWMTPIKHIAVNRDAEVYLGKTRLGFPWDKLPFAGR